MRIFWRWLDAERIHPQVLGDRSGERISNLSQARHPLDHQPDPLLDLRDPGAAPSSAVPEERVGPAAEGTASASPSSSPSVASSASSSSDDSDANEVADVVEDGQAGGTKGLAH